MKKVCVLGLGYIGLPTAAMLGTNGYEVIGVDVDPRVVEVLRKGDIHIEEPGLRTLVEAALRSGHLNVCCSPEEADVFIIAVPTPLHQEANSKSPDTGTPRADLTYVRSAAQSIVPHLRKGNLVILESTSPPGTTVGVVRPILEQGGLKIGRDLCLVHSPERVLPGRVLQELVSNDRVIGAVDDASAAMARSLYASFVEGEILETDATTAEMVKLMENTYRDVNIALANEFALIAEQIGVDVWGAIRMANRHPRVNVLRPGPGVGGHCIAVDPWFIVQASSSPSSLIRNARHVNDAMPHHVVELVRAAVGETEQPIIACLGVTYKADVDDVRESPAVTVIRELAETGGTVRVFDPYVQNHVVGSAVTVPTLADAVRGADCAVLLTDHAELRSLHPDAFSAMRRRHVIDTRGCLDRDAWRGSRACLVTLGVGDASWEHAR